MLIGVIQKKTFAELAELVSKLDSELYDLLELRLDGMEDFSLAKLASLQLPLPAIFTLRAQAEGGRFAGSEAERVELLEELIKLKPAYMDLEASLPPEVIQQLRALSPTTHILLSRHDFQSTPASLDRVLEEMQAKASEVTYKLAVTAHNATDALRMLLFCRRQTALGFPLIGISMGEHGASTRILAPVVHRGFCYCPVEEATAPGQLDAASLHKLYNFSSLKADTSIYGLLGDPVQQSIGHVYHNESNFASGCNAVYVKWRMGADELPVALPLLAELGVKGLSVTMPLKEAVVPCLLGLDEAGEAIGAVNTLRLEKGGYVGTNTDGPGALDILPMPVEGLNIVVIGAGGAARAIVWEASRRGAGVLVYNRTAGKPLPGGLVALPLRGLAELDQLPCDIIINTLPFDSDFDFRSIPFRRGMLAYDISYARKSHFLEQASSYGCATLDGSGMFMAQAALQRRFWNMPV